VAFIIESICSLLRVAPSPSYGAADRRPSLGSVGDGEPRWLPCRARSTASTTASGASTGMRCPVSVVVTVVSGSPLATRHEVWSDNQDMYRLF
jgi:hypothetical protein